MVWARMDGGRGRYDENNELASQPQNKFFTWLLVGKVMDMESAS